MNRKQRKAKRLRATQHTKSQACVIATPNNHVAKKSEDHIACCELSIDLLPEEIHKLDKRKLIGLVVIVIFLISLGPYG